MKVTLEQQMFSYRSIEQSVMDRVVDCLNAKMSPERDSTGELLISQLPLCIRINQEGANRWKSQRLLVV